MFKLITVYYIIVNYQIISNYYQRMNTEQSFALLVSANLKFSLGL